MTEYIVFLDRGGMYYREHVIADSPDAAVAEALRDYHSVDSAVVAEKAVEYSVESRLVPVRDA